MNTLALSPKDRINLAKDIVDELQSRGLTIVDQVEVSGPVGQIKPRMSTREVADYLNVKEQTVRSNARAWKLVCMGRNQFGKIWSGASVLNHEKEQKGGN